MASPIVAMMTSVDPRAFMAQPSASDSRKVRPPSRPPMNAPANFPRLAMAITASINQTRDGVLNTDRSVPSPARPKNTGANSAVMRPRSCSSMWRVRIGDSPTRMPATNAPSTV
jgi:hypothetical protein